MACGRFMPLIMMSKYYTGGDKGYNSPENSIMQAISWGHPLPLKTRLAYYYYY